MKTIYRILFAVLFCNSTTVQAQVIKHSYRFFNNFAASSIECGPELVPAQAAGNCNGDATSGGFITDNLPQCGVAKTVYHTNMHWGLRYPNTSNTITDNYTIHLYVKTTDFGTRSWARIIDFSNGALDEGIYYKSDGATGGRCLDFYPSGIVGACPYFDASTYYLLTFTRNGTTGIIDVYVNNTKFVSYNDAAGRYTGKPGTPIYIYRDDQSVTCESGAANIAFLSFTNQYATQSVVTAVYDDICAIANTDNAAAFSFSKNPICGSGEDVTVTYTGDLVAPATGHTFNWDWDGGTVKSGSGMGPYVVNWATAGNKNVKLTINSTTCSGTNSSTKTNQLQVKSSPSATINQTICQGQSFEGYRASGIYVDKFTTTAGCDSVRTLHLVVTDKVSTVVNKTICTGQSYEGYDKTGTYVDTYTSASGCDSVRTLNLTVNAQKTTTVNETICSGQQYALPSGRKVGAGVYIETLQAASGCDSVVTYQIVETSLLRNAIGATICSGAVYALPSGKIVNAAGTFNDTLRYRSGCDSVITTVTLTSRPILRDAKSVAICAGQNYALPSGKVVTQAGIYGDTVRYRSGCDSLITEVALVVHPVYDTRVNAAICSGQTYRLPSGKLATTSGTYREAFNSSTGCDSIITTELTVTAVFRSTTHARICAGQVYRLPSGRMVKDADTYEDKLTTVSGCDSIVTTVLSVVQPVRKGVNATVCTGALYTLPSGKQVSAGVYTDTLNSSAGCDSIITTTVTEYDVKRISLQAAVCMGNSYQLPSGKWVTAAGVYKDTLRYTAGCDSVVATVTLEVFQVRQESVQHAMCQGGTYQLPSGRLLTASGFYKDTLRNTSGCDSLITIVDLTVTPRSAVGVQPARPEICSGAGTQLQAFGGTKYQWLPAPGITDVHSSTQQLQPTVTTTYRVIITNESCGLVDTVATRIVVHPMPQVQVTKSNDVNCSLGQAQLRANGAASYQWSPVVGLRATSGSIVSATPDETTTYTVTGISAKGCTASATVQVVVAKQGDAYLPNAFTPNADGLNDCFGVRNWGVVKGLQFRVFNRWGHLVFETTDPTQCWDGTYKGQKLNPDTFVYQISGSTNCGPVFKKGTVSIVR